MVKGQNLEEDEKDVRKSTLGGRDAWQGLFLGFQPFSMKAVSVSKNYLALEKSLGMTLLTSNMFKDAEKCTICGPLIFSFWVWIQTRRM